MTSFQDAPDKAMEDDKAMEVHSTYTSKSQNKINYPDKSALFPNKEDGTTATSSIVLLYGSNISRRAWITETIFSEQRT